MLIDAPGATLVLNGDLAVAGDFVLDAGQIEFNGGTLSVGNFTENGGLLSGTVNIHAGGTISFSRTNAVGPLTDLEAAGMPLTLAEAVVPGAVDLLSAGNVGLESPLVYRRGSERRCRLAACLVHLWRQRHRCHLRSCSDRCHGFIEHHEPHGRRRFRQLRAD